MPKKRAVKCEVSVGDRIIYRSKFHAVNGVTLVDTSVPHEADLQREVAAVLLMGSYDLVQTDEWKDAIVKLLATIGEDLDEKPESLTAEQFRARLGGKLPNPTNDLPF